MTLPSTMLTISSSIIKVQKPATLINKGTDWMLLKHLIEVKITTKVSLKTAEVKQVQNLTTTIQQGILDTTSEVNI